MYLLDHMSAPATVSPRGQSHCVVFLISVLVLVLNSGCSHQKRTIGASQGPSTWADMMLQNGVIFTARDEHETVRSLAIAAGKILAVGSRQDLKRFVGPQTQVIDLKGKFVCPGFHDAHLHFEAGGRAMASLNFFGMSSLDTVLAAVRSKVAKSAPNEWITGGGWDHTLWPGQRWPTRHDLDRVAADNPVYLKRVDGHAAWVNSKALSIAGITAKTADPKGGEIVRETTNGFPSGILKEAATKLVTPATSRNQVKLHFALALQEAKRLGITSVHDIDSSFNEFTRLRDTGRLTVRIYKLAPLAGDLDQYDQLRRRLPRPNDMLVFGALKGFVDGTLGSSTAALLEPYTDRPETHGTLVRTQEDLNDLVKAATLRRFQVALHAIGDKAARQALKAFAVALPHGGKTLRHRLEHVQVVHPDDLPLFSRTGAIASIQPCHLITDQRWVERRLGHQRARQRGYPWRGLHEVSVVAVGTDWPVEPLSPFRNLYAATKVKPLSTASWHGEHRLTIGQALRAYTYGSAFAAFAEDHRGTLEPGKDADLVVLDRNLLAVAPAAMLHTKVLATILAGKLIFGSLADL